MTEIDVLEITKLLRLTRFWMTKNVSRRQREMTKYFDDYTLMSDKEEVEPPLAPGHPIEQPRQEASDERIRDAKAGFLELKAQKHLTDFPSVEKTPFTPSQQRGLFEDLDYTYGSMDHWMVKSILPHVEDPPRPIVHAVAEGAQMAQNHVQQTHNQPQHNQVPFNQAPYGQAPMGQPGYNTQPGHYNNNNNQWQANNVKVGQENELIDYQKKDV